MTLYTAEISFRGNASVSIYAEPGETIEVLMKLSDKDLAERIVDYGEITDQIEDDDIVFDDITERIK